MEQRDDNDRSRRECALGWGELAFDIDNRGPKETWLNICYKGEEIGHIVLTLNDLFGLIESLIDNVVE